MSWFCLVRVLRLFLWMVFSVFGIWLVGGMICCSMFRVIFWVLDFVVSVVIWFCSL